MYRCSTGKIVERELACCSETEEDTESRIFTFLEATLRFIAKTLPSGFDHLLVLLHDIFCDQHHFYANCSGNGACEDITDLGEGMGAEVYDDGSLIQVSVVLIFVQFCVQSQV
jgi:hypothetical protein